MSSISRFLSAPEYADDKLLERNDVVLGQGGYGNVRTAVYRQQAVAVKRYQKDVPKQVINREIEIMKLMKGEFHVVQYIGWFVDESQMTCVLMELAYNLSLRMLLDTIILDLSENLKVRIARDLCCSLECLHRKGIAHEDVKSENVLLDFGLRAKLCDFGTAKFKGEEFAEKNGTKKYRAPEKEHNRVYDRLQSDIYSLGLILREILGNIPIVLQCLSKNPTERPGIANIIADLPPYHPAEYKSHLGSISALRLGEAERINLAYYWTGSFDPESEDRELREGRRFFHQGVYEEALEKLTCSETAVAKVLLGIMRCHGYGCERDLDAALKLFEECLSEAELSENSLTLSVVEYYSARIQVSQGKTEKIKDLFRLSNLGNAFAQTELSNIFSQRFAISNAPAQLVSPVIKNGSAKHILDLLHKAAKTGYAHAQAMLALFYIAWNKSQKIPPRERDFLERSVEGGSLVGSILQEFVSGRIDVARLIQLKDTIIIEFVGDLLYLTGMLDDCLQIYAAAAKRKRKSSIWAMATLLKKRENFSQTIRLFNHLLEQGFYSLHEDDWYFFKMLRHITTVEYDLVDCLMLHGCKEEAMNIVLKSSDTSSKAIEALFNLCDEAGQEEWHELLVAKREHMRPDVINKIAYLYFTTSIRFLDRQSKQSYKERAREWFEEAVKCGSIEAVRDLAEFHFVEGNVSVLSDVYRCAVDAGDPAAMLQMAINAPNISEKERKALLIRAVALREPVAMLELGLILRNEGKLEDAEGMFKDAFMYGVARAALELTFLIVQRYGEVTVEAKYWFQQALLDMSPKILYEVGCAYEEQQDRLVDLMSKFDGEGSQHNGSSLHMMGMIAAFEADYFVASPEAYHYFSLAAHQHHHAAASTCLIYCLLWGDKEGILYWKNNIESRGCNTEQAFEKAAEWKLLCRKAYPRTWKRRLFREYCSLTYPQMYGTRPKPVVSLKQWAYDPSTWIHLRKQKIR